MTTPEIPIEAKVFAFLFQGIEARRRGNLPAASKLTELALRFAEEIPPGDAEGFRALGLCSLTRIREKEGRPDDAAKVREEAIALVDRVSRADLRQKKHLPQLLSAQLVDLQEYRRAIPFCEKSIEMAIETNDPLEVAHLLSREGHCYSFCGLKEQAAIPLRAALKILRDYPDEPKLTEVLIGLGNALRKSAPEEAEALWKEAAEIHVAKAHLETATPAWGNLGILCAEQGRYSEALSYYQKVLDIREKAQGTSPDLLAMTLNNMAECHRRTGDFAAASQLIDRAIGMLGSKDLRKIAAAYGTKGHIFHDSGNDAEAVEWLRKSYVERQKQPNPDYGQILENLGYEIESLKRLGRADEIAEAESRVALAKEAMNTFPDANVDIRSLTAEPKGAVLIELAFGSRPGGRYGMRDAEAVLEQLFAILGVKELAKSGGRVVIPESITLTFYGEDAEAMFAAMEQYLSDHLIFAGAVVSIRQGKNVRQVVIPTTPN